MDGCILVSSLFHKGIQTLEEICDSDLFIATWPNHPVKFVYLNLLRRPIAIVAKLKFTNIGDVSIRVRWPVILEHLELWSLLIFSKFHSIKFFCGFEEQSRWTVMRLRKCENDFRGLASLCLPAPQNPPVRFNTAWKIYFSVANKCRLRVTSRRSHPGTYQRVRVLRQIANKSRRIKGSKRFVDADISAKGIRWIASPALLAPTVGAVEMH